MKTDPVVFNIWFIMVHGAFEMNIHGFACSYLSNLGNFVQSVQLKALSAVCLR